MNPPPHWPYAVCVAPEALLVVVALVVVLVVAFDVVADVAAVVAFAVVVDVAALVVADATDVVAVGDGALPEASPLIWAISEWKGMEIVWTHVEDTATISADVHPILNQNQ